MAGRDISIVIEELGFSGKISLGRCCKQTLRNWVRDVNYPPLNLLV